MKTLRLQPPKFFSNQSGQGVVEYVLILVVTVAIILGGILQLNQAFASWANTYFGEYLSCLLETGELPSLGNPDAVTSDVCQESFVPFTIANGRPPIGSGGGSGSSGSPRDRPSAPGPTETASEGGGSSSRMQVRPQGLSSGSSDSDGNSRGGARGGKEAKAYTGSSEVSSVSGLRSRDGVGTGGDTLIRYSRIGGHRSSQNEEEDLIPVAKTAQSENSARSKDNRIPIQRKVAAVAEPDTDLGLSVGDFFRLLIIAAIIIAIFVFFAGQAVQINKSM